MKKEHKERGFTYCRPGVAPISRKERTSNKWCDICGYKKRGANHDEGSHHKKGDKL